jgi:hypothetical protein
MATTHEPFHLDKQSFLQCKIVAIPTNVIWIIISFTEFLNMAIFRKYDVTLAQTPNYCV